MYNRSVHIYHKNGQSLKKPSLVTYYSIKILKCVEEFLDFVIQCAAFETESLFSFFSHFSLFLFYLEFVDLVPNL